MFPLRALACTCFLIQAVLGDGNLFTLLEGESSDGIKDCNGPEILSCKKIQVHFEALDEEEGDEITLETLNITLGHMTISDDNNNSISYSFHNEQEDEATFTLTNNLSELTGEINLPNAGRAFEIANCGIGCHVLIEENMAAINNATNEAAIHPEDSRIPISAEVRSLIRKGELNRQCVAEVTLTVYLTPQFLASTSNPVGFVTNAVAVANAGFQNSGAQIRLRLHCIYRSNINEGADFDTLLTAFTFSQGGAPFNNLRRSADMAMLITARNDGSFCGKGWLDSFNSKRTMTVVAKDCVPNFTFGHELGHNFGAHHDMLNGFVNPAYSYGHGYRILLNGQPSGYRTIMAVNVPNIQRVNFWSFDGFLGNFRMGTSSANNVRVLNRNRFAMARVGNENMSC